MLDESFDLLLLRPDLVCFNLDVPVKLSFNCDCGLFELTVFESLLFPAALCLPWLWEGT